MHWFVIYAARPRTRARITAPHVRPPQAGRWLSCTSPADEERSMVRYTAILAEEGWRDLREELGLDLERVGRDGEHATLCEAGPLPALFVDHAPMELPGVSALRPDIRTCVVGPVPAIALALPPSPVRRAAATGIEVGLCISPLPESEEERERVRSLFAAAAFSVGGAEVELRCPECASPELGWVGGPDLSEQMRCGNCGERLQRDDAFLRLGDCEEILAATSPPPLAVIAAAPGAS